MRLTHYLTEEYQESRNVAILDSHLEQIKKTSKPWIKIAKSYPIFRGLKATSAVMRKKVRTDRHPKDTPLGEHEVIDQAFFDAFGWYPRSSGLFVVGDAITAGGYGDLMLIFPIGKISYLYSDYFSDLYMSLRGMSWDAGVEKYPDPDDPRNIKAATPDELKYITDKYTDKNILNILKRTSTQPEIMINCREYWAINVEVAFEWLIQRGLLESRYLLKKGAEMFMKEAILK